MSQRKTIGGNIRVRINCIMLLCTRNRGAVHHMNVLGDLQISIFVIFEMLHCFLRQPGYKMANACWS